MLRFATAPASANRAGSPAARPTSGLRCRLEDAAFRTKERVPFATGVSDRIGGTPRRAARGALRPSAVCAAGSGTSRKSSSSTARQARRQLQAGAGSPISTSCSGAWPRRASSSGSTMNLQAPNLCAQRLCAADRGWHHDCGGISPSRRTTSIRKRRGQRSKSLPSAPPQPASFWCTASRSTLLTRASLRPGPRQKSPRRRAASATPRASRVTTIGRRARRSSPARPRFTRVSWT